MLSPRFYRISYFLMNLIVAHVLAIVLRSLKLSREKKWSYTTDKNMILFLYCILKLLWAIGGYWFSYWRPLWLSTILQRGACRLFRMWRTPLSSSATSRDIRLWRLSSTRLINPLLKTEQEKNTRSQKLTMHSTYSRLNSIQVPFGWNRQGTYEVFRVSW